MTFKSASTLKFVDVILWLSLILSLLFITVCLRNWCVYMKCVPTNYTWNEISHLKCAFRIFMAVWIRAIMRLYVIKWICLIHAINPSAFIFGLWLVISLIWSHLNSVCFFIFYLETISENVWISRDNGFYCVVCGSELRNWTQKMIDVQMTQYSPSEWVASNKTKFQSAIRLTQICDKSLFKITRIMALT